MKVFASLSLILFVALLLLVEGGLSSCTKDNTIYDTVTVTKTDTLTVTVTDTVVIKDTVLTDSILTSHSWKLQEVKGVIEGDTIYYSRGGIHNTESFDNEYIVFYSNHTGLLVDNAGGSHVMTSWGFVNSEHTKLEFTLYNDLVITSKYTWDNIRYKNSSLYMDEYFHDNLRDVDAHDQQIRIPK